MKLRAGLLVSATLVTPLLVWGSAAAVSSSGSDSTKQATTNTTTPKTEDNKAKTSDDTAKTAAATTTTPASTDDKAGMAQRIADRKAALKTKLSAADQKKLSGVCKAAQGKATSTSESAKGLTNSRDRVYAGLNAKLVALVPKLQDKKIDTAELEKEIAELQKQVAAFNASLTTYQQSVSDLVALDCASDPAAFKASLDAARTNRETLSKEAAGIKAYVKDTIKPTLQKLREQLEQADKKGSN